MIKYEVFINDNEEGDTIKRDVYIQWRVGGIKLGG